MSLVSDLWGKKSHRRIFILDFLKICDYIKIQVIYGTRDIK